MESRLVSHTEVKRKITLRATVDIDPGELLAYGVKINPADIVSATVTETVTTHIMRVVEPAGSAMQRLLDSK